VLEGLLGTKSAKKHAFLRIIVVLEKGFAVCLEQLGHAFALKTEICVF
jgi:hypothetical protein